MRSRISGASSVDAVLPRLLDHPDRRAELAGRAVAALEGVVLDERGLQRVQLVAVGEPLDGRDLRAVVRDGEREAARWRAGRRCRIVHAPHWPWSQPFFAPVSPRCSRRRSSSVVRTSTASWCSRR